jgi:hypothetical protein
MEERERGAGQAGKTSFLSIRGYDSGGCTAVAIMSMGNRGLTLAEVGTNLRRMGGSVNRMV